METLTQHRWPARRDGSTSVAGCGSRRLGFEEDESRLSHGSPTTGAERFGNSRVLPGGPAVLRDDWGLEQVLCTHIRGGMTDGSGRTYKYTYSCILVCIYI